MATIEGLANMEIFTKTLQKMLFGFYRRKNTYTPGKCGNDGRGLLHRVNLVFEGQAVCKLHSIHSLKSLSLACVRVCMSERDSELTTTQMT